MAPETLYEKARRIYKAYQRDPFAQDDEWFVLDENWALTMWKDEDDPTDSFILVYPILNSHIEINSPTPLDALRGPEEEP